MTNYDKLKDKLLILCISDLQLICLKLKIKTKTKLKSDLVDLILAKHFNIPANKKQSIPQVSCGKNCTISLDGKILYGSYKNDKATRDFFQQYLGPKFHFTVQGMDWIKERWVEGNPPTYQEFIDAWYDINKKSIDKPSLQYNKFCKENSGLSKLELKEKWNILKENAINFVYALLTL